MADAITVEPTQKSSSISSQITTSSENSLNRRACRICQSETGVMMRPCGCIGTVGDIHETCLNQWVGVSQKKNCEICNEEYRQSGWQFKPLSEWSRPRPECRDLTMVLLLIGHAVSIAYMFLLFDERKYVERCWQKWMDSRSDDMGRIAITVSLILCFLITLTAGIRSIYGYCKKQKEIRFLNKEDQQQ